MNRLVALLCVVLALGQLWPSKERILQMVRHRAKCNVLPDKRDIVLAAVYGLLAYTFWIGG
jgi:hypothetical protein